MAKTYKSLQATWITRTKNTAFRKNFYKYGKKKYHAMTDVMGYGSVQHTLMEMGR